MPRISLAYDVPVTVIINTETRKVESVTIERTGVQLNDCADTYDVDTDTLVDTWSEAGEALEGLAYDIAESVKWPAWTID